MTEYDGSDRECRCGWMTLTWAERHLTFLG